MGLMHGMYHTNLPDTTRAAAFLFVKCFAEESRTTVKWVLEQEGLAMLMPVNCPTPVWKIATSNRCMPSCKHRHIIVQYFMIFYVYIHDFTDFHSLWFLRTHFAHQDPAARWNLKAERREHFCSTWNDLWVKWGLLFRGHRVVYPSPKHFRTTLL